MHADVRADAADAAAPFAADKPRRAVEAPADDRLERDAELEEGHAVAAVQAAREALQVEPDLPFARVEVEARRRRCT